MKGYLVVLSFLTVFICACDSDEITSVQSDSFIKYYSLNRSNEGTCVTEIPGGGYALLGNTTTDLRGSEICLLLTDAYGNSTQRPKYYGRSKDDRGYCIKSAPDGGFVILGSTEDRINDDKETYLIRTDDFGDTLWTRTFEQFDVTKEITDDEGFWFDFSSKGEIVMVGYAIRTETAGKSKQIWIYSVDQNGNQINSREPITNGGISDVDEARFIQRIDGDNFLITGVSKFLNFSPAASYSFLWFLESDFDTDPNYIESIDFITENDTSTQSDEGNCLTVIDNNTILLCGSRKQTSGISDAYLCRFNRIFDDENKFNPNLEWIRYYNNGAGSSKATHLLMDATNAYILSTMSSGTDKPSTVSVITAGLEGNNAVYMPIGGASKMVSRNFSFTTDGGFIITGTNTNNDIIDISSMILIKTKSGGKL